MWLIRGQQLEVVVVNDDIGAAVVEDDIEPFLTPGLDGVTTRRRSSSSCAGGRH